MAGDTSPGDASERTMFAATAYAVSFKASPSPVGPNLPAGEIADRLSVSTTRPRLSLAFLREKAALPSRPAMERSVRIAVSTEIDRGTTFILVPVFLALGAIAYFSLGQEPGFLPLAGGAACLAAMNLATRSWPALNLLAAALFLCVLGMGFAKIETWRAGTKMLGGEISTQLTGHVAAIENMANGRVRLTIDVAATARPVLRFAPDRVRVSARKIPEGVEAGSVVTGLVRLIPPSGPVRPGSYDFSFESYFDGIGASGFFLRGPELASPTGPAPPSALFRAAVERFRNAIAARISHRIGGAEGEIAAALVVGVRAGIPEDVNEVLRRAGIYHIISISGLHMALVAGTIMGLLRAAFALFPEFSSRRPVKKFAAVLAIAGLAAYLFISGGDVAAQRSFIMLAVMLIAVLFDRAALTMRNLAISAIVVILISPHEVTGPSFQMSFAATAALVGAYSAWSDYRSGKPAHIQAGRPLAGRIARKLFLAVVGLAVTSLVAGGATAIYAAYHFQQMPSLGLATNVTAMPIVSVVVMPFAVLGTLAMPFNLDGPFFDVMGWGLAATIAIARWFSERSPADIVGLVRPTPVIVLTIALLIATISTTWLRAAALPVALVGPLMLASPQHPDLLISEDARLVGLAIGNGRVAVNRARPNQFTIDNWKRALLAETLVEPVGEQKRGAARSTEAGVAPHPLPVKDGERGAPASRPVPSASVDRGAPGPQPAFLSPSLRGEDAGRQVRGSNAGERESIAGFICADGLCLARHPSGAIVAHAADAEAAARACRQASVIVIDDASAKGICRGEEVLVVTKLDLARHGSAAITFAPAWRIRSAPMPDGNPAATGDVEASEDTPVRVPATIAYAIQQPYRPWHGQRHFSREARGLPPYRRPKAGPAASPNRAAQPDPQ